MFNWFKKLTAPTETWGGTRTSDNVAKLNNVLAGKVISMKAIVQPTTDGKTALRTLDGTTVATYARSRDAYRGATRRGFTVVN